MSGVIINKIYSKSIGNAYFFSFIVQNVKKDWKKRLACIILQPMSDTPEPLRMLLIVPCYNEEANIPLFVESAEQNLKEYDWQ